MARVSPSVKRKGRKPRMPFKNGGHADARVTKEHYGRFAVPSLRKMFFDAIRDGK